MEKEDIDGYNASWVDHDGVVRKTPNGKHLHMARYPLHAALRAFVYSRDGFTCKICGTKAVQILDPASEYSGFENLLATRKSKFGENIFLVIDHVVSRRNGGSNHPSNLQTLCDSCNSAKSGLVDAKVNKNGSN